MKRGWCPSLYAPMPSGDGLLVRVKPPGARLDPAQAVALAEACARFGNGVIELTQRGNLQVRGLSAATVAPFAAAVAAAGLADPDPAREARRAVVPTALAGDDPGMAADAASFTAALEAAFTDDDRLAGLPGKFALAVDAGGVLGGRAVAADLVAWTDGKARGLRVACRDVAPPPVGFLPYPGTASGAFGCAPPFGQMDAAMLAGFAAVAARFGTTIRVTPWRALLLGRVVVQDDRIGLRIGMPSWPDLIRPSTGSTLHRPWRGENAASTQPFPRQGRSNDHAVDARIKSGHDGASVDAHTRSSRVAVANAVGAGFITDPADPRLRVTACPGAPACGSGTVPARADAARLRPAVSVHVSGCPKGCAHPGPAPWTLVGRDGRYDVVRDGRAGDVPMASGLSFEAAMALVP